MRRGSSSKKREAPATPQWTLDQILQHPELSRRFENSMRERFAWEHYGFFKEVELFRQLPKHDEDTRKQAANALVSRYIATDSDHQLMIEPGLAQAIEETIRSASSVPERLFDRVQYECYQTMKLNYLSDFLASPQATLPLTAPVPAVAAMLAPQPRASVTHADTLTLASPTQASVVPPSPSTTARATSSSSPARRILLPQKHGSQSTSSTSLHDASAASHSGSLSSSTNTLPSIAIVPDISLSASSSSSSGSSSSPPPQQQPSPNSSDSSSPSPSPSSLSLSGSNGGISPTSLESSTSSSGTSWSNLSSVSLPATPLSPRAARAFATARSAPNVHSTIDHAPSNLSLSSSDLKDRRKLSLASHPLPPPSNTSVALLRVVFVSLNRSKVITVSPTIYACECKSLLISKLVLEELGILESSRSQDFRMAFADFCLYRRVHENRLLLLRDTDLVVHWTRPEAPDDVVFQQFAHPHLATKPTEEELSQLRTLETELEALCTTMRSQSGAANDQLLAKIAELENELRQRRIGFHKWNYKANPYTGMLSLRRTVKDALATFQFRLHNDALVFSPSNDRAPGGAIPLTLDLTLRVSAPLSKRFYLNTSQNNSSEYELDAETEDEAWAWVDIISHLLFVPVVIAPDNAAPKSKKSISRLKTTVTRLRQPKSTTTVTATIAPPADRVYYIPTEPSNVETLRLFMSPHWDARLDDSGWAIRAGTVSDILQFVVLSCDRLHADNSEAEAFLFSYFHFVSPKEMAAILEKTYRVLEASGWPLDLNARSLEARYCNFVSQALSLPPLSGQAEYDDSLRDALLSMIQNLFGPNSTTSSLAQLGEIRFRPLRPLREVDTSASSDKSLWDFGSAAIASQLTLVEAELYRQVTVAEFLDLRWQKNKALAPGLVALTERFNTVASWTTATILGGETVTDRVRALKRFISIGKRLLSLRNYNTCSQIISGITSISITRIRHLQEVLENDRYADLITRMKSTILPLDNYKFYRALNHDFPCIPALAVYLRDLTFIQEGNQLHQTAGVINYERLRLFAKTVRSTFVGSHAASSYVLEHDPVLFRLCLDLSPIRNEDELYQRSLELCPLKAQQPTSSTTIPPIPKSDPLADRVQQLQLRVRALEEARGTLSARKKSLSEELPTGNRDANAVDLTTSLAQMREAVRMLLNQNAELTEAIRIMSIRQEQLERRVAELEGNASGVVSPAEPEHEDELFSSADEMAH